MRNHLATFKYAPTKTLPSREGPVQCVRNCTNCILGRTTSNDVEVENVIAIKSYDNLVLRQSLWLSKYQSIQYHLGQIDVFRTFLLRNEPGQVIYVVATTRLEDLDFLARVLKYEGLPKPKVNSETSSKDLELRCLALPYEQRTCAVNRGNSSDELLNVRTLRDLLEPIVEKIDATNKDVALVPVSITKDHDKYTPLGLGSVCVLLMEPYSLREYLSNLRSQYKVGHIVHHLYHDLAMYSPRLPCHVVAFLMLYLDRPCGVSRDDLNEYIEWILKSSMELNLHLAYTGKTEEVIEFALMILEDYIRYDPREQVYRPINIKALSEYASLMVPNMAYHGVLSRAALMLHNRDEKNALKAQYDANSRIKVMKDDVLEVGQDLAERIDTLIPCRRPCVDIYTALVATFNSMQTFGKYFYTKEARIRPSHGFGRYGDYDSDEEYYLSKRDDPAFKPWIIFTQRPYRLDRLNLFMNCIEPFCEQQ